ncbi:hypothetical protein [Rhodococcus opacus]|uniref:hypothetical protein n=1 Tax=Rhodococcus opacus TaxID=37919 RepID=UPI002475B308|nr:hypothetical protein [Rhodococcus opacus]MDH6291873.1 hypothetical protein [Rhodococcus opacus]
MSNFMLNLPIDIPWRRRCVSEDMLDSRLGNAKPPLRWRSSIAIFEYEPDADNQNHDGLTISYLKVACTLTGYQVNSKEIGVRRTAVASYWADQPGIVDYVDTLEKYYACFGAVLEVSALPEDRDTPLDQYPYIMDFEPKKRELYQMASDTNERESRSVESLNLTKSAGSTQSLETYDVDTGGGFGGEVAAKVKDYAAKVTYQPPTGQWGTKRVNSDESMSARTTNVGEEKRESYSFSTQLSQLYHQLDSYHLGTNRALFFVLPRPHTLETERTFVNGIRNIEGVQEFFLVVARPKDQPRICVEAYLETAHIGQDPRVETQEIPGTEKNTTWPDSFSKSPPPATTEGGRDKHDFDETDREWKVDTFYPGYKIKSAVLTLGNPVYDDKSQIDIPPHISDWNPDYVRVSGRVHSSFGVRPGQKNRIWRITYPFSVDISLVKTETVKKSIDTLFLTARRLFCCGGRQHGNVKDGVVFERKLATVSGETYLVQSGPETERTIHNAVQEVVRRSRDDLDHRYPEPIPLVNTDFAANLLVNQVPAVHDRRVDRLEGLPAELQRKLSVLNPEVTVADLLVMPIKMQQDVLSLSLDEVMQLRDALTGASHVSADPKDAWLSSDEKERLFKSARADDDTSDDRHREDPSTSAE